MNILKILIFSFGVLLIIFGISIFTPFFSCLGKKFNSSNNGHFNYNQPFSIRATSILLGVVFFMFGICLTIASAAFLHIWNPPIKQYSSVPQSVSPKPEIFGTPMVPAQYSSDPSINTKSKLSVSKYRLKCPMDVDGLNMRKTAGLNREIVILIPCDAIEIKDTKQREYKDGIEWYLVKYKQNTGWVAGKYLEPQVTLPSKTTFFPRLIAKKKTLK